MGNQQPSKFTNYLAQDNKKGGDFVFKDIIIDNEKTGYKVDETGLVYGKHGRPLKPRYCPSGYIQLCIWFHRKALYLYLHRVVYETFKGIIPGGMEVNHIDGNKLNNNVDNLEIVTRTRNAQHSWEHGLSYKHNPHIRHNIEKRLEKDFPLEVIEDICKDLEQPNLTYFNIAKRHKCLPSMVSNIANGKLWPTISSKYDISGRIQKRRKMIAERDVRIANYRCLGYTIKEISILMEMTFDAVARRLYLMNQKRKLEGSTTISKGSTLK